MTEAYAEGRFVAKHLNDGDIPEERIQPNGVDLTIQEVFETNGTAIFTENGYSKPQRAKIQPTQGRYVLTRGQYPVVYFDRVKIPEGYVGRVYPRSRLMRCGLHLTSALWESGYEGVGEGLLEVPILKTEIEAGVPIAQMCFIKADSGRLYKGSHQQERLTEITD